MVYENTMDLIYTTLEVIAIEYLLYNRVLTFDKRYLRNILLNCVGMIAFIRILTVLQVLVPLKVALIITFIAFLGSKLNKRLIKNGFFIGTLFMLAISMSELIAMSIHIYFNKYLYYLYEPSSFQIITLLISKLTLIIFVLLLKKLLDRINYNIILSNWMIIFIPNFLNLGFMLIVGNQTFYRGYVEQEEATLLLITVLIILVSTVCFIITSVYYLQSKEIEHKNKMNMAQLQMQYEYFCNRKEDDLKIKELYHDMKNHLLVLQNNLENDQKQNYINSILKEVKVIDSYIDTGNDFLNSIINEKYNEAMSKGIDFNARIDFSEISFITPMDICTIFSNALDNAIEACEKNDNLEQKVMSVKARKVRNFLTITFENCSTENLIIENEEIITTKQDKIYHGFGLNNIKKVVEKYQGECKIKKEIEKFILYLVIPCTN